MTSHEPAPSQIQLPPRFVRRFRRGSAIVGVTVIVAGLLIYAVILWLAPIIAHGVPTGAVAGLCGLPTLFVAGIGVAVTAARSCLNGDRLVVERARRFRATFVGLLAGLLVVTLLCGGTLTMLAEPAVDGLILAFMLVFTALVGLIGFASGVSFVRPTAETIRRMSDHPVW